MDTQNDNQDSNDKSIPLRERIRFRKKKAEKVKEIDRQLEELLTSANIDAGSGPAQESKQYASRGSPFTAISTAAGRLLKPAQKESRMIDDQLNSLMSQSEEILKGPIAPPKKEIDKPLNREPVVPQEKDPVRVEKVEDYKAITPIALDKKELTDMVNDVKVFAAKYKEGVNGNGNHNTPAAAGRVSDDDLKALSVNGSLPAPAEKPEPAAAAPHRIPSAQMPEVRAVPSSAVQLPKEAPARDPLKMDFTDDIMSLLKDSAKIEKEDKGLEIMRDMKGREVTCGELEKDLTDVATLFKKANARRNRRSRA